MCLILVGSSSLTSISELRNGARTQKRLHVLVREMLLEACKATWVLAEACLALAMHPIKGELV